MPIHLQAGKSSLRADCNQQQANRPDAADDRRSGGTTRQKIMLLHLTAGRKATVDPVAAGRSASCDVLADLRRVTCMVCVCDREERHVCALWDDYPYRKA